MPNNKLILLQEALQSASSISGRTDALFALCDEFVAIKDSDSLFSSAKELRNLGASSGNAHAESWGILYGAMSYSIANKFEEAIPIFEEVLGKFEKIQDKSGIARTLLNIGRIHAFLYNDLNKARDYFQKALELEIELNNPTAILRVVGNFAMANERLFLFREHLELIQKVIPIIEQLDNKPGLISLLNQASLTAIANLSDIQTGISFAFKAHKIAVEINDKFGECYALDNIGAGYWYFGDAGRAIEYYSQCIKAAEETESPSELASRLTNAAYPYMLIGDYEKVLELNKRAKALFLQENNEDASGWAEMGIGIAVQKLGNPALALEHNIFAISLLEKGFDNHGLGYAYFRCGEAYVAMENYEEAFIAFNKSLEHRRLNNAKLEIAEAQCERGKLLLRFGEIDNALITLMDALSEAERISAKAPMFAAHHALSQTYAQLGDFTKAYQHLQLHISIRDEVQNQESTKKAASLDYLHKQEVARKEREIEQIKNLELAKANDELTRLNSEKNEFLGIAAHDLKNPLASVAMSVGILKRYGTMLSKDETSEKLTEIENTVKRMVSIISNILNINAIERGAFNFTLEAFDLRDVAKSVVNDYRHRAEEKRIKLLLNLPETMANINADKQITTQIADNLVSNAIKYSPKETKVVVEVTVSDSSVRFKVQDEGPGLSEEDQMKLFGRYQRLSAQPTGGEHSTGLGLSIVKKLVEGLNGKVWCESELGKGATFLVEFPALKA